MSGNQPTPEQQREMVQAFMGMPMPQFVFNGFAHQNSAIDFTSILMLGPRPVASLLMSPTVAKSFAAGLLDAVQKYEEAIGAKIETVTELNDRMMKHIAAQEASPEPAT